MRQDQIERLKELSEDLADILLEELEPSEWPGAGMPMSEWTKEIRGDRVWTKKNAMATGGVLRYTLDLVQRDAPTGSTPESAEQEADLDRQIHDAERRAADAVKRVLAKGASRELAARSADD